jgi:hypothetical protein
MHTVVKLMLETRSFIDGGSKLHLKVGGRRSLARDLQQAMHKPISSLPWPGTGLYLNRAASLDLTSEVKHTASEWMDNLHLVLEELKLRTMPDVRHKVIIKKPASDSHVALVVRSDNLYV